MHKYVQKFGESELQLFTVRFVSLKRYVIKLCFVGLKMYEIKVRFVCINMYENSENPNRKYWIDRMEKSHF